MGIPVGPGTKIVFVGDSITFQGWFSSTESLVGGTGLLVQQLSLPTVTARVGAGSGTVGSIAGGSRVGACAPVSGGGQVYAINSGISGNKIADIEAAIAARITNYNPAVVVLEVGVNDCRGLGTGTPTPIPTFRASYDNVLATVKATLPGVAIVCVSIFCAQEKWTASGGIHYSGNPYDQGVTTPSIEDYDAEIQASALAHSCTYVDVRGPGAVAESTMNTPAPGAVDGVLTLAADGIHPSAAGQLVMSTAVYSAFTFTP